MSKKNKIILALFSLINIGVTLWLTIVVIPDKIPLAYNLKEEVSALTTKWIMIIAVVFPLILSIFAFFVKNKSVALITNCLFVFAIYENTMFFTYFSLGKDLTLGAASELPLSLVTFTPLALLIMVLSMLVKHIPYNSKFGIKLKQTKATEFLWKQTHFFAKNVFFVTGLILTLISIIFAFFKLCYIELALFAVAIITMILVIYFYANSIYKKYMEMKDRQNRFSKKTQKEENSAEK